MPTWVCASKSSGLSRAVSTRWDSCAASGGHGQYRSLSTSRLSSHWYWAGLSTATSRWSASQRTSSVVCSRWWTLQQDRSLACGALIISLTRWPVLTGCVLLSASSRSYRRLCFGHCMVSPHRTVLIRRPSSLGGYPVAATSAVRVFAAARRAAHSSSFYWWLSVRCCRSVALEQSLPHDITNCVSLTSFCRKLKTF